MRIDYVGRNEDCDARYAIISWEEKENELAEKLLERLWKEMPTYQTNEFTDCGGVTTPDLSCSYVEVDDREDYEEFKEWYSETKKELLKSLKPDSKSAPWKIWLEWFNEEGEKTGAGVMPEEYKHKSSAMRAAKQFDGKPGFKCVVSQENPFIKKEKKTSIEEKIDRAKDKKNDITKTNMLSRENER